MISEQEFRKGRQHVPFPLRSDAYSISSNCFASEQAKEKSVYNFVNRYSPTTAFPSVANDSRMVLYGLSHFIRNHLTQPIDEYDVLESHAFMEKAHSFGGPLNFDYDLWMRVVNEYDGYLPIRIEALPEGSTFFPNEPVIQVTSLDSGFGELAAHIEALMVGMVSTATAKVTLFRHWLDRLREWVEQDSPPDVGQEQIDAAARVLIHDFGMRASSCAEESELLGLAHLLVFHGTDTFNAAYLSSVMNGDSNTGKSILALAHRSIQGHETEEDAFRAIHNASKGGVPVASYVSDCYNYHDAILQRLIPLAKEDPDATIVCRPDSGNYVQNVLNLAEYADEHGLSYQREDGHFGPKNLRFINGDSMNPEKVENIMRTLNEEGFAPTEWGIYGVGGYGRNEATRDALSSAFKLSSCGIDSTPVVKLSESRGKLSVPGPNRIIRNRETKQVTVFLYNEGVGSSGEYVTYYEPNKFYEPCRESFSTLQQRTIEDFDSWSEVVKKRPKMGLWEDTILSDTVQRIQQEFYERYR